MNQEENHKSLPSYIHRPTYVHDTSEAG